ARHPEGNDLLLDAHEHPAERLVRGKAVFRLERRQGGNGAQSREQRVHVGARARDEQVDALGTEQDGAAQLVLPAEGQQSGAQLLQILQPGETIARDVRDGKRCGLPGIWYDVHARMIEQMTGSAATRACWLLAAGSRKMHGMPPAASPPTRATSREWIGLAVLTLPCLVYAMDLTVLNLAVPQLTQQLRPSAAQLLWILDIYGFLVAGALVTMGTLGDRIGMRRLLMIGALVFAASSLLAAFAQTAMQLIL